MSALEQQLQELETELGQLRTDSATLDQHLAKVAATLSEPEKSIRKLEPVSLYLGPHQHQSAPRFAQVANSMTFQEIVMGKTAGLRRCSCGFPATNCCRNRISFKEANRLLYSTQ